MNTEGFVDDVQIETERIVLSDMTENWIWLIYDRPWPLVIFLKGFFWSRPVFEKSIDIILSDGSPEFGVPSPERKSYLLRNYHPDTSVRISNIEPSRFKVKSGRDSQFRDGIIRVQEER